MNVNRCFRGIWPTQKNLFKWCKLTVVCHVFNANQLVFQVFSIIWILLWPRCLGRCQFNYNVPGCSPLLHVMLHLSPLFHFLRVVFSKLVLSSIYINRMICLILNIYNVVQFMSFETMQECLSNPTNNYEMVLLQQSFKK